jgi:nucleotide-binding universal stress UspA family protein
MRPKRPSPDIAHMTNDAGPTTIVAIVNGEAAADPVVQRATELAFERGARVVLYDVGARTSPLESPLPTEFASDGPDRGAPPLLTADDLEAAGQAPLARRVRALAEAGIEAYGWLPETAKPQDLRDYARAIGASEVIATSALDPDPDELVDAGLNVEAVGPR